MAAGTTAPTSTSHPKVPSSVAMPGHHHRDAIRLLFILAAGSEDIEGRRVFRGEKRAMAIDFLGR